MNYTIIVRDDGRYICAKRIKKSQWYPILEEPKVVERRRGQSFDYRIRDKEEEKRSQPRIGPIPPSHSPNTHSLSITNTADNSFIEEDMLNKSFLLTHDVSVIEEQPVSEDPPKLMKLPISFIDAQDTISKNEDDFSRASSRNEEEQKLTSLLSQTLILPLKQTSKVEKSEDFGNQVKPSYSVKSFPSLRESNGHKFETHFPGLRILELLVWKKQTHFKYNALYKLKLNEQLLHKS